MPQAPKGPAHVTVQFWPNRPTPPTKRPQFWPKAKILPNFRALRENSRFCAAKSTQKRAQNQSATLRTYFRASVILAYKMTKSPPENPRGFSGPKKAARAPQSRCNFQAPFSRLREKAPEHTARGAPIPAPL